jgi:type IV pilus biogenesis protein CpaD/CtpE
MRKSRIEKPLRWPTIWIAGAIAAILAGCTHGDAAARKAAPAKTDATQEQKPVKLRYYGGPKYPMYPG